MARVIWSPQALRDLDAIHSYINQFDPVAAARMVNALLDAGDRDEAFPRRGRPGAHGRRELPSVPPYVVRYAISADDVTILTVKHGARRPD